MRKAVIIFIILFFALSSFLLISGILNRVEEHKNIEDKISKLPEFSFMTLNNGSFNSSEIKRGPVLVIRFHPECEHCQFEIPGILKSNVTASGTIVIMVSGAHPDSTRKFLERCNYKESPSFITLIDTSYIFGDIFGSNIVPSNYIYNKELNLIKVIQGEVKTETILKYLNGIEQDK